MLLGYILEEKLVSMRILTSLVFEFHLTSLSWNLFPPKITYLQFQGSSKYYTIQLPHSHTLCLQFWQVWQLECSDTEELKLEKQPEKTKKQNNNFVYLLLLLPTSPLEVAASFSSTIPMVIAASGTRLSRKQHICHMGEEGRNTHCPRMNYLTQICTYRHTGTWREVLSKNISNMNSDNREKEYRKKGWREDHQQRLFYSKLS